MDPEVQYPARVLESLIGAPVYSVSNSGFGMLSRKERAFIFAGSEDVIAFTCPVADLLFRKTALRYHWRGRGACVAWRRSPSIMSPSAVAGTTVHEVAHWLTYQTCAEWSPEDTAEALKNWWHKPARDPHGRDWQRATIHLWCRAVEAGLDCSLADCYTREKYGLTEADERLFLCEAIARQGEDLADVLRSPRPIASRSISVPVARPAIAAVTPAGSIVQMMPGLGLCEFHPDGSVSTAPLLGDRTGASVKRFASEAAMKSYILKRRAEAAADDDDDDEPRPRRRRRFAGLFHHNVAEL